MLDGQVRAVGLIGGGAPGYAGKGDAAWEAAATKRGFSWGAKGSHALFPARAMELMVECMNTRLLGRVRDQLALTYSCEVELNMFKGLPVGNFTCKVFASPDRLHAATSASLEVLRSPGWLPFTDREVDAVKRVFTLREVKQERERDSWIEKMRPIPTGSSEGEYDLEEASEVLEQLTTDDVQRAWGALTGLEDPFVILATSGPPGVQQMVMPTPVVRDRPPPPSVPSFSQQAASASVNLNLLD